MTDSRAHPAAGLPFRKMHGLGNDFVVIDARAGGDPVTPALARRLADRNRGVGFDQLAVIAPARNGADAQIVFWNGDGSVAGACGNATRCVADLLMRERAAEAVALETANGVLAAERQPGGQVRVDMGPARFGWRDIPLAEQMETDRLPLPGEPAAVAMPNPHCIHFVDDADAVDLERRGPEIETHPVFPERTNVEFCHLIAPDRIRMRVWERGTGITLACGSGACAVAAAAHRLGRAGRAVTVVADGGELQLEVRENGHVLMTGPVSDVFEGVITPAFLGATP